MKSQVYDVAVIGAGIVGLAHALAALKRGKSVVIIDRDARAVGASIRNFGFITITGQRRGATWKRARRSRDVWVALAEEAGIPIEHRGLLVTGRRPESKAVLEAFLETEMGSGCELLDQAQSRARHPEIGGADFSCALWSPHEVRVESRNAIPTIAAFLAEKGVTFLWQTAVRSISAPTVETSRGLVEAETIIVCPGDDLSTLFPERIAAYGVTRCKLHMMRLADPGFRLPGAIMSDLSLVRYRGYADLPESKALRTRLETEQAAHLDNGVHLIVVQSSDGSLVVGDSHHYAATPDPFAPDGVDELVRDEFVRAIGLPAPAVTERWTGTYASAPEDMFMDAPEPGVRLVMVTSGTGASTAFAIAEETIADLFSVNTGVHA